MFITQHWNGRNLRAEAFRLGVDHGVFCLGCCWALMLLMFAVGVGNLGWMLGLGAVMAIEKNWRWGRRLSRPLGALLLTFALILTRANPRTGGGTHPPGHEHHHTAQARSVG